MLAKATIPLVLFPLITEIRYSHVWADVETLFRDWNEPINTQHTGPIIPGERSKPVQIDSSEDPTPKHTQ